MSFALEHAGRVGSDPFLQGVWEDELLAISKADGGRVGAVSRWCCLLRKRKAETFLEGGRRIQQVAVR